MIRLPADFRRLPLAHRALHDRSRGRPENSRAAIRAAIAAGYGIEIDLQLSADGRAMVFHDETLDRLTAQRGPVNTQRAADLARIALRDGDGEGIPPLDEILALVAGRVPLLIELKDQHGRMGPTDRRLERAVAQATQGYDGPLALMSFNPHSVLALRDLAPALPRGLVTCAWTAGDWPDLDAATRARLRDIPDFDAAQAGFISHEACDLGRARVAELRGKGAAILCWTIRSAAQEEAARAYADNITFEGYLAALPA